MDNTGVVLFDLTGVCRPVKSSVVVYLGWVVF